MNRQKTAAKAQKPAGKAKKETTKKTEKAKPWKPGKAKAKTATLSVMIDGKEIGPGKKRANPKSIIEECEKVLKDARKANPLLDAFLGFLKHIGFDRSEIKAVYMAPKLAGKPTRKAPAEKAKKRGAK